MTFKLRKIVRKLLFMRLQVKGAPLDVQSNQTQLVLLTTYGSGKSLVLGQATHPQIARS